MNLTMIMLHGAHSHEGFNIIDLLLDTLIHGLKMLPLLFVAYLIIETVEHKAMDKLKLVLGKKETGVLGGSVLGLFPECGFSVAAANLYAENFISAGGLAAVFIATSDEALPIILSSGDTRKFFLPTVGILFILSLIAGFLIDFVLKFAKNKDDAHEHHHHYSHSHEHVHEAGEHHHCSFCDSNKGIFLSTLKRTFMTLLFLLATIFVFNSIITLVGESRFEGLFEKLGVLQPFIAALIGLIPSCAVSITLVGLFTEGVISYGALMAGLASAAGVGIAVLVKSSGNFKKTIMFISYIWLFSSVSGLILSIFA